MDERAASSTGSRSHALRTSGTSFVDDDSNGFHLSCEPSEIDKWLQYALSVGDCLRDVGGIEIAAGRSWSRDKSIRMLDRLDDVEATSPGPYSLPDDEIFE
jgi:hypothetical protein